MKGNNLKYLIISLVIIIIAAGGFIYYYFCIDTVNDYVLLKYTPPKQEESIFGGYTYSTPEFKFENLPDYKSDRDAIEVQKNDAINSHEYFLKKYQEELDNPSENNDVIRRARLNACESLLTEQRILIRTTHTRRFDAEEALQMVIDHWADQSLEEYAKSKKIEVAIYQLN